MKRSSAPVKGREKPGGIRAADLPDYCDYTCAHASFAAPDAVGACRREQAVWCAIMGEYVAKNGPCLAKRNPVEKKARL